MNVDLLKQNIPPFANYLSIFLIAIVRLKSHGFIIRSTIKALAPLPGREVEVRFWPDNNDI